MKAAVLYETKQPLVLEDVELDDPKEGEVLVKIGAAGICRSDRHFMHGDAPIALPVVLGHEGAGTVERVGPGVTTVRPGEQVILSFVPACGRCHSCLEGNSQVCDTHMATGPNMLERHLPPAHRRPVHPSSWARSPASPNTPWSPKWAAYPWNGLFPWTRPPSSVAACPRVSALW